MKQFKQLALGDTVVTGDTIATPSAIGLVKIGNGLVVDQSGAVYLKILQDNKLFLPTGETLAEATTIGGKSYAVGATIYRAISLVYSEEQHGVVFDISEEAYVWNDTTKRYVEVV